MRALMAIFALATSFGAADATHAQSSDFENTYSSRGTEARLQFSIPLGESHNRSKTRPRMDFVIRNYNQSSGRQFDWMRTNPNSSNHTGYSETRLGFTLESKSQWMVNDQLLQLPKGDAQANIRTAGKVGLGVAAVLAVVVVGGIIYLASSDCFLGEAGGDGCGT